MTLDDWLDRPRLGPFFRLFYLPDRKLHLMTAAFLRRVWYLLPSHHTRTAVEATEDFADNLLTARELAQLRSTDLLETCEPLWTNTGYLDEDLIGLGCPCCESARTTEYECRLVQNGYVLDGVHAAVENPRECAVRAAGYARELVRWGAPDGDRDDDEHHEKVAQFGIFSDITGPEWHSPRWPRWRTADVRALARGIHRDRAFDRLPILADALQDAGCDAPDVLRHCREEQEHVRGCWVVDLAMGIG